MVAELMMAFFAHRAGSRYQVSISLWASGVGGEIGQGQVGIPPSSKERLMEESSPGRPGVK